MEEIRNKDLEQLLVDSERLDWSYTIHHEPEYKYNNIWFVAEKNYVELEQYSIEGEYFTMIIDFDIDNPVNSFMKNLKKYSEDFDVDVCAEMWLSSKVGGDSPKSFSELKEDAETIKYMIVELLEVLDS